MSKKPVRPVLKVSEQELKQLVQAEVREEVYSGPLPHPEHLKKYDDVYPGAAKIIIETFIKQSDHRRNLESKVVTANVKNERLGQIFAFVLSLIVIGCGGGLIYFGKNVAGLAAILTPLAALTGIFFGGKRKSRKDLEKKI